MYMYVQEFHATGGCFRKHCSLMCTCTCMYFWRIIKQYQYGGSYAMNLSGDILLSQLNYCTFCTFTKSITGISTKSAQNLSRQQSLDLSFGYFCTAPQLVVTVCYGKHTIVLKEPFAEMCHIFIRPFEKRDVLCYRVVRAGGQAYAKWFPLNISKKFDVSSPNLVHRSTRVS